MPSTGTDYRKPPLQPRLAWDCVRLSRSTAATLVYLVQREGVLNTNRDA